MSCRRRFPFLSLLLVSFSIITLATSCTKGSDDPHKLHLRPIEIKDPAAGGITAFTLLLPEGWEHEGGVVWRPHLANQAAVAFWAWNPEGSEVFELLPCDPFIWNPQSLAFFGPGSLYLGNEVRQPVTDPAAFIMQFVIPRYRHEITDPQLVSTTALPQVAAAAASARAEPGARKQGYAATVRIAYTRDDVILHEDFTCVLLVTTVAAMPGIVLWGPDTLYSCRAEPAALDQAGSLLHIMATSVQPTAQWFNTYVQIIQMWQRNQMQAIADAGRISQIISQTSSEISDMVRQAYENRQSSQDRIHREFSETIRGVETYNDPYRGRPVELPSQYRHAWVSDNGEYVLSDEAGFNPNIGDTRTWKRLDVSR